MAGSAVGSGVTVGVGVGSGAAGVCAGLSVKAGGCTGDGEGTGLTLSTLDCDSSMGPISSKKFDLELIGGFRS